MQKDRHTSFMQEPLPTRSVVDQWPIGLTGSPDNPVTVAMEGVTAVRGIPICLKAS